MIVGTNHFVSTQAAVKYYADYGYNEADVLEKAKHGEIVVGVKPELKPGQTLRIIDNGTRYAVEG
jgi:hypothetical protein